MSSVLKLSDNPSFELAIELLDSNGNGILPVIDKDGKFAGIITDGDIRKAILYKNLDLESIINKEPYTLDPSSSEHQKVQFLKSIKRRQLPLVDHERNYVGMFTLDEFDFSTRDNWVVIMAGGLGSRLGELTKELPKPMLQVRGKPIIERIIENFVKQGFTKFYLAVNYKKEIIKDYFQDGKKFGIQVSYLEESKRLGTAGALALIEEQHSEPMLISNGDVLADINYAELVDFHERSSSMATMCVKEYEHIVPYGVIETEGDKITGLKEKPRILFNINSGVYCIDPKVINRIPQDTFYDMPTLFSELMNEDLPVTAYSYNQYWIDIGRPDDFKKANDFNEIQ
ncbi:alcohol dehydrogenase [Pseudoalteromonas sp. A25]|uniref:nucleotidyltransferase family protein n=1 Tax=Pseudoalteromonas sp. A25 TaxID=116092 RepID=UPI0012604ED3|nr:nucleotidyltransferase family protein [Pseudoalteromonas sp. A25]BBN80420.1 alcohol dehydrogenase [Pseudoalteromonas sp. A25]